MLELLDQVEDVITVEELLPSTTDVFSSKDQIGTTNEVTAKFSPTVQIAVSDPPAKVTKSFSSFVFLVLEVGLQIQNCHKVVLYVT